ncbi:MAG: transcriptional regulator [Paracoccaceae bacterium]
MARVKSISDDQVLSLVCDLQSSGGTKAVSFGAVARATRLAPSTLVQRFGTVEAMRRAAVRQGWQALTEATIAALAAVSDKGPQGLLKTLDAVAAPVPALLAAVGDEDSRALAADWRKMVEAALALRLGQGDKARETASILFAAWQGQMIWGGDSFRLKDAVKRLT